MTRFHAMMFVAVPVLLAAGGGVAIYLATRTHAAVPPSGPPPPPHFDTQLERGAWLFANTGCTACHGEHGHGGVVDLNYATDTVPALDVLADQLGLDGPEDVAAVIAVVEHGQDPGDFHGTPPFPGWDRFAARWRDTVAVVQNGSVAGKKDPAGPEPPLQMPSWRTTLQPDAIRAVLVYLLSLYDWNA